MKKLIILSILFLASSAWASLHYMHTSSGDPTGGVVPSGGPTNGLQQENESYLLLETGDYLLQE